MNYNNYSISGINLILLILTLSICISCGRSECGSSVEYLFINESDYQIVMEPLSNTIIESQSDFSRIEDIEGPCGKLKLDDFVPPILEGTILFNNGEKCWILDSGASAGQGEGPAGISNYEYERISNNSYRLTFRFTNTHYQSADICI